MKQIRQELEQLICQTTQETFEQAEMPQALRSNLDKWHWGSYGWVSPASLIFTATWRKYFYPHQDCCKIWAKDETNHPIEGGYSIRSEDESITIPLLANSGMQGSRAIEKMRNLKRLNTNFDNAQRTIILIAKNIRKKRLDANAALRQGTADTFSLLDFLNKTADPELTKCVAAACFDSIYKNNGLSVGGVSDYKTAKS